jgi:hypothetical protein
MSSRSTPLTRDQALARLAVLSAERHAIYRAFPDLKPRPAWRTPRAARPPLGLRRIAHVA